MDQHTMTLVVTGICALLLVGQIVMIKLANEKGCH